METMGRVNGAEAYICWDRPWLRRAGRGVEMDEAVMSRRTWVFEVRSG